MPTVTTKKKAKASVPTRPSPKNHNPKSSVTETPADATSKPTTLPGIPNVRLDAIERDDNNHRLEGPENKAKIVELQASLRVNGLEQPVLIFDRFADATSAQISRHKDAGEKRYILSFGFRRCAAAELNGWADIPALIKPAPRRPDGSIDYGPIQLARAIENLDRDDLNPIEEGVAVAQLIDALPADLGGGRYTRNGYGPLPAAIEEVALRLGRPEKWVRDRLYFQRLGAKCRKWVAEGRLRLSFAREIAKLADHGMQEHVAGYNLVHDDGTCHGNLNRIKSDVASRLRSLKIAPWQLEAQFPPDKRIVGPCSSCPFNSSNDKPLFEHDRETPELLCLKGSCFEAKVSLTNKAVDKAVATIVKKDLPATESSAREVAADFVKPGRVAREAKKEKASDAPGTSRAGDDESHSRRAAAKKLTPEERAKEKLDKALETWTRESGIAVEKAIQDDPAKFVAAATLTFIQPFAYAYDVTDEDVEKHKDLIALLVKCDAAELAVRAAEANRKARMSYDRRIPLFEDGSTDALVEALIDGWKLDVKPKPRLEDFLPSASSAQASKPSPRGKKAKAAEGAAGDDDAEDDGAGALDLDLGVVSCRVCGCTEEDCSGCIRATGGACSWVSDEEDPDAMTGDLCSACTPAARRARYEAAAPGLGLVGKDVLGEPEYLALESGNRNTAGRVEGLSQAGVKRLKQLGLVTLRGGIVTITQKGLQAIGRDDSPSAPPPATAIEVLGIRPEDLEAATGEIVPSDPFAPVSPGFESTIGRPVQVGGELYAVTTIAVQTSQLVYRLHPLRDAECGESYFTWGFRRLHDKASQKCAPEEVRLEGTRCKTADGRTFVFGPDEDVEIVRLPKPPTVVENFGDDGDLVDGSLEKVVDNPGRLRIHVARTVGGRWLEGHSATVSKQNLHAMQLAGPHPSRTAALNAAVDAVRDWLLSVKKKPGYGAKAKQHAAEITRWIETVERREAVERAKSAHGAVISGGGSLEQALNAGVGELVAFGAAAESGQVAAT